MKKLTLLGTSFAIALLSSTAMASDFQALSVLQGVSPAALQDSELASTEGGSTCTSAGGSTAENQNTGGVCLVGDIGGAQGASFAVANDAPVTGANFLQVTGGL
ncbi:MAG: hypothetical protein KAH20_13540 [Methylococcales bacterium]|nr:hypothetical protein [Methylococcales bacterium]